MMLKHARGVCTAFAVLFAVPLATQRAMPQQAAMPAAHPQDVASVDAIIAALYDVISGDSGVVRDWDRFRSLFAANNIAQAVRSHARNGVRK